MAEQNLNRRSFLKMLGLGTAGAIASVALGKEKSEPVEAKPVVKVEPHAGDPNYWTAADQRVLKVKEMETDHLKNCVRYVYKDKPIGEANEKRMPQLIANMKQELKKRGFLVKVDNYGARIIDLRALGGDRDAELIRMTETQPKSILPLFMMEMRPRMLSRDRTGRAEMMNALQTSNDINRLADDDPRWGDC